MLRRDELVAEITERGGDAGAEPEEAPEPKEPPERRREAKPERERLEDTETEDVVGVLEVTPQRYGFLRFGGLEAQPDDVYVSASRSAAASFAPATRSAGPPVPRDAASAIGPSCTWTGSTGASRQPRSAERSKT